MSRRKKRKRDADPEYISFEEGGRNGKSPTPSTGQENQEIRKRERRRGASFGFVAQPGKRGGKNQKGDSGIFVPIPSEDKGKERYDRTLERKRKKEPHICPPRFRGLEGEKNEKGNSLFLPGETGLEEKESPSVKAFTRGRRDQTSRESPACADICPSERGTKKKKERGWHYWCFSNWPRERSELGREGKGRKLFSTWCPAGTSIEKKGPSLAIEDIFETGGKTMRKSEKGGQRGRGLSSIRTRKERRNHSKLTKLAKLETARK